MKPRRRTNKKLSTAAQLEQTREGCVDLETPDSILVHTNLRALLNRETFQLLPPLYQYKLVQLLPPVDRPPLPDAPQCERNGIRLNPSGLNNEFFTRACHEWRDRLAEGEFTPEAQLKLRLEAERERGKLDPWKLKHFEPMWGDQKYVGSFVGAAGTMANPTPPTPPPPPPVPAPPPPPPPTTSTSVPPTQLPQTVKTSTPLTATVAPITVSKAVSGNAATIVTVARQSQQPPSQQVVLPLPSQHQQHPARAHPVTAKIDPSSRSLSKMQAITFGAARAPGSMSTSGSNTIITSSTGTIILPPRTTITVTSAAPAGNNAPTVVGSTSGLSVVPISIVGCSSVSGSSATVSVARPALKTTIKLRPTTAIATSTTAAAAPAGEHPYTTVGTGSATKRILPTTAAAAMSVSSSSGSATISSSTSTVELSVRPSSLPMSPKRLRTVGAVTRSALAGTSPQPHQQQQQQTPHQNALPTTSGSTITLGSRPVVVKVVEPYRPAALVRAVPIDPSSTLKRTHSGGRALTPTELSNSGSKLSAKRKPEEEAAAGYAVGSLHGSGGNPRRMVAVECDTRTTPTIDGRMVMIETGGGVGAFEKRRRGGAGHHDNPVSPVAAIVGPTKRSRSRQGVSRSNKTGTAAASSAPLTTITIVDDDVGVNTAEKSDAVSESAVVGDAPEALRRRIAPMMVNGGEVIEVVKQRDRLGMISPPLVPSADIILEEAIDCGDVVDAGEQRRERRRAGKRLKSMGGAFAETAISTATVPETIVDQQSLMNLNNLHAINDTGGGAAGGTTQMIYDQNTGQVYSVMCLPQSPNSSLNLRSLPPSLTVTALPQQQQQQSQPQQQLSISNDSSNSSSVSTTAMMAASDNHLDGGAAGGATIGSRAGAGLSTFENVLRLGGAADGSSELMIVHRGNVKEESVEGDLEEDEMITVKEEYTERGLEDEDEDEEEDDDGDGELVHTTTTTTTTNTADEEEEDDEEEVGEVEEGENGEEFVLRQQQQHLSVDDGPTPRSFNGELIRVSPAAGATIGGSKLNQYSQASSLQHLQQQQQHHHSNHLHTHLNLTGFHHDHELLHQQQQQQRLRNATVSSSPSTSSDQGMMMLVTTTADGVGGRGERITTVAAGPSSSNSGGDSVMVMGNNNYCDNLSAADEADGEEEEEEEEEDEAGEEDEEHEEGEENGQMMLVPTDGSSNSVVGMKVEEEDAVMDDTIVDQYGNHHHLHHAHLNHHDGRGGREGGGGGGSEEEDVNYSMLNHQQHQQFQQQQQHQQFNLTSGHQQQQTSLLHNHSSLVVTSSAGATVASGVDTSQMQLFSGQEGMLLDGGDCVEESCETEEEEQQHRHLDLEAHDGGEHHAHHHPHEYVNNQHQQLVEKYMEEMVDGTGSVVSTVNDGSGGTGTGYVLDTTGSEMISTEIVEHSHDHAAMITLDEMESVEVVGGDQHSSSTMGDDSDLSDYHNHHHRPQTPGELQQDDGAPVVEVVQHIPLELHRTSTVDIANGESIRNRARHNREFVEMNTTSHEGCEEMDTQVVEMTQVVERHRMDIARHSMTGQQLVVSSANATPQSDSQFAAASTSSSSSSGSNWPQFKMKMMDTTKMMVVDHHQLVDGNNSIIISPIGTSGPATMIPSPAVSTFQQQQQHQLHPHLTNSAQQQQQLQQQQAAPPPPQQHTMQQQSPSPISMGPATTATIVQQIAAHNHHQQQQLNAATNVTTTGISFLAQAQPTVQTMTAAGSTTASMLSSPQQQQQQQQGLSIFQLHPSATQQQQHQTPPQQ
uniref:ASXH domain-containing protein n=1 Tax=Anopheles dirus TaxID=7168 RepID=A0A182N9Q1_9DIPT